MKMVTAPAIRVRWGDAGCSASARMRYAVPRDATGVRDALRATCARVVRRV